MSLYLSIAFGGALGAMGRFWLSSLLGNIGSSGFPVGTFFVNLIGSFLIGVVYIFLSEKILILDYWRPLLMVGFLGAFTTFSTFSLDALLLFQQGHYNTAFLYVVSSVILCLFAAYAGMQLVRLFV